MALVEEIFTPAQKHFAITINHNTPQDVATALEIASAAIEMGRSVSIIDMTKLTSRGKTYFPEMLIRRQVWKLKSSPINQLRKIASERGFNFITISSPNFLKYKHTVTNLLKETPKSLPALMEWNAFSNLLGPATASYLTSLVSPDEQLEPHRFKKYLRISHLNFLHSVNELNRLFQDYKIDEVSIFNGRYPAMAAALFVAKDRSLEVFWHEIGRTPDYIFFEKFRPHDRVEMQHAMKEFAAELGQESLGLIFEEFVVGRSKNVDINPFLQFQKSQATFESANCKIATIFTSSPDETVGIGTQWSDVEWTNQYEALGEAIRKLKSLGFAVNVRIHPNLITKSWQEFLRAASYFKNLDCLVFLPTDNVNSYDLIDVSEVVVVWRSTLGLESCARGVTTFCLGRNKYDISADVVTISSRELLANCNFLKRDVNVSSCIPGILWNKFSARRKTTEIYKSFIFAEKKWAAMERRFLAISKFFLPLHIFFKFTDSPRYIVGILFRVLPHHFVSNSIRAFLGFPRINLEIRDYAG